MKALNCMMVLGVFFCAHLCSAASPAAPTRAKPTLEGAHQAYANLLEVTFFAFGGVGLSGRISEGEEAFHTVLVSTNALSLFRKALAKGSNEAKVYALCGIHHLDKGSFDSASKALVAANPEIKTITGCLVGREKAATIVKRIADGLYDRPVSRAQK